MIPEKYLISFLYNSENTDQQTKEEVNEGRIARERSLVLEYK